MTKLNIYTIILFSLSLISCGENKVEEEAVHQHEKTESYVLYNQNVELFVDFTPLSVGNKTDFIVHFTDLKTNKPIEEGEVTVSLIKGKKGIRSSVNSKAPGVFIPVLEPKTEGDYTLVFELESANYSEKFEVEGVHVYASEEEAQHESPDVEENSEEIAFTKEQAWKMDVRTANVQKAPIYQVLRVGGEILPAPGDEYTITSTTSGIIMYSSSTIAIGNDVNKGQRLFMISGGDITDNNVETEFKQAKSNYLQAKSNYERKQKLFELKSISKSIYEEALLNFEVAESKYTALASNYSKGGKIIKSGTSGYLKNLLKREGDYVELGEPIAVITKNKRLTLRADVSQKDYEMLNNSITANFRYDDQVYKMEAFNGRLLSYGKSVTHENPKVPVYFEVDNAGVLLPGSYIEMWVKTNLKSNALVIPRSSLLDEYGAYVVIVRTKGEGFEKRQIEIGISDGINVEVISGLKEGERIVSKGAYQLKMASLGGQIPDHGHSH